MPLSGPSREPTGPVIALAPSGNGTGLPPRYRRNSLNCEPDSAYSGGPFLPGRVLDTLNCMKRVVTVQEPPPVRRTLPSRISSPAFASAAPVRSSSPAPVFTSTSPVNRRPGSTFRV